MSHKCSGFYKKDNKINPSENAGIRPPPVLIEPPSTRVQQPLPSELHAGRSSASQSWTVKALGVTGPAQREVVGSRGLLPMGCVPQLPILSLFHLYQQLPRLPGGASGKEPTCQGRRCKRRGFDSWVGKIPWRREWQPTPVFLPGEPVDRGAWWATVHGVARVGHDWSNLTHTVF